MIESLSSAQKTQLALTANSHIGQPFKISKEKPLKASIRLISYLFHPIFVAIFGMMIYFLLGQNYLVAQQKVLLIIQLSIVTIFIPLCVFYLLKTLGKADTVMLSDISQRKIPLLLQSLLLYILITKSIRIDFIPELYFFLAGGILSSLIAFAFLFSNIKTSLHLLGMGSLLAFTIGMSLHNQINAIYIIASLILITGMVATSRLFMNAHTIKELTIGFFVGSLPQIALWYFWL